MTSSAPHLIDFKFATVKALSIALRYASESELIDELNRRLKGSGGVYFGEPAVLDFSEWTEEEFQHFDGHIKKLVALIRKSGINPVELKVQHPHWEDHAEDLGLRFNLLKPGNGDHKESPTGKQTDEATAPAPLSSGEASPPALTSPEAERKTLLVDQAVRSGQRIYAQGADLIIMGQVSAGAEVIADGNVHVYGVLRGRALAGAAGDTHSRIISTCFEPELVSIAGYYLTFEAEIPKDLRSNPTLVYLDAGEDSTQVRLKPINIR